MFDYLRHKGHQAAVLTHLIPGCQFQHRCRTLGVIERRKSPNNFPMARNVNGTCFASNEIASCMVNV